LVALKREVALLLHPLVGSLKDCDQEICQDNLKNEDLRYYHALIEIASARHGSVVV
jgi:hypothetical protein